MKPGWINYFENLRCLPIFIFTSGPLGWKTATVWLRLKIIIISDMINIITQTWCNFEIKINSLQKELLVKCLIWPYLVNICNCIPGFLYGITFVCIIGSFSEYCEESIFDWDMLQFIKYQTKIYHSIIIFQFTFNFTGDYHVQHNELCNIYLLMSSTCGTT